MIRLVGKFRFTVVSSVYLVERAGSHGTNEVWASFHFSLAYSALASFRMGTSGSASFQRVRKS